MSKQVWWSDWNGQVKSGTLIDTHTCGKVCVSASDGYTILERGQARYTYLEAINDALGKTNRDVQASTKRQSELMVELAKLASPQKQDADASQS